MMPHLRRFHSALAALLACTLSAVQAAPPLEPSPLRREFPARSASAKPPVAALFPKEVPVPTSRVNIRETVFNGFVHPGVGLTKEMLETARAQLLAGKEPWVSGYIQMTRHRYAGKGTRARNESTSRPGEPDTDALNSEGINARVNMDGERAQQQALMYYFTGDEVYRANALGIVRVWSKMDPAKYAGDYHISAGWAVRMMVVAAELLRSTDCENPALVWSADDTARLTRNFIDPMIQHSMSSNGYFMNQHNFPLMGAMAACIFTSQREGYNQRVEWFTVNRTAENQGMSGAIKQLARLVEKDDKTGKSLAKPVVQLAEMGRDQAHAAEDINLFVAIADLMMAQGTRVDPVAGTVSTAPNAVGPFEFLHDRILAAADYFCRFMLGYDTPWTPIAFSTDKQGKINDIYPRIADQYRGRMTTFFFWDLYFYYTYNRKLSLAKIAPFLDQAYRKRITDIDWLRVPVAAQAEGQALVRPAAEPGVIEVERLSTLFDKNAVVATEGSDAFLRVTASPQPARVGLLSAETDSKLIGLRVRTTAPARIEISGLAKPWTIPDTNGRWLCTTYALGEFERLKDFANLRVSSAPGHAVEIDQLIQKPGRDQTAPSFTKETPADSLVTFAGAPFALDFAAEPPGGVSQALTYEAVQLPPGATLSRSTGTFHWRPSAAGESSLVVQACTDKAATARVVRITVAPNRSAALRMIAQACRPETSYARASRENYLSVLQQANSALAGMTDEAFVAQLGQLQNAANALEPLSPLLADGTLDYSRCATSPELKQSLIRLTDGNSDTFAEYFTAKDRAFSFDFGPDFKVSSEAFELLGRLNFEVRAEGAALFGSDDGKSWTRLTPAAMPNSKDTVRLDVAPELRHSGFRFLRLQKTTGGIFEVSELRIHGRRLENPAAPTPKTHNR